MQARVELRRHEGLPSFERLRLIAEQVTSMELPARRLPALIYGRRELLSMSLELMERERERELLLFWVMQCSEIRREGE